MSASLIAPQSARPGSSRWPGLRRKKVTLALASTSDATDTAGFAVDPGWDVHSDHAPAGVCESVEALDDHLRFAVDVAREPGPEQRVDHAVGARDINRRSVEGRPRIARGGERRIAFQRVAPTEQSDLDLVSARGKQPRGDEAVAAVAAGAADDGDPAARLCQPRRLVGDRETSPLHKRDARRSGRDRKAIGLAHLSGRQQFRERLWIAHGSEGARGLRHAQASKTRFPSRRILVYPAGADPR